MTNLVTIDFHGRDVLVVNHEDKLWVVLKRVCENLNLDWESQRQRTNRDSVLSVTTGMIPVVTTTGKKEALCLPLEYLNGFLFGIDDSRIQDVVVKDSIRLYKLECYKVLYNHFHPKSNSVEITNPDLITALNAIVKVLPTHNAQINALYDGYLKLSHQQDQIIEEIKEAFQIVKSENLAAINSLKSSIIKANANSATPNGRMVTLAELKRDPALGPVAARFINNRSNQSLAQSLSFWTEHNGQKLGRSGSVNLYPYNLAITFFDESTNPYIKKYI